MRAACLHLLPFTSISKQAYKYTLPGVQQPQPLPPCGLSTEPQCRHRTKAYTTSTPSNTATARLQQSHRMTVDRTLVSFDVDGTLIHSIGLNANKLHKDAFAAGFKEVFGVDTHIDVVAHHGSTDPLIIIKVMEYHGFPKDKVMQMLPQVEAVMVQHFQTHAQHAAEGIEMLPGVKQLLARLQAHGGVSTCLVTGNLEPIGWTKMAALGLDHLFTQPKFGGFGSDFCSGNTQESWLDRAELVKVADKKGKAGTSSGWRARYHVGDTPMDVQAAIAAGAIAIGVTTGIFSAEQLRAAAPPDAEATGQLIILPSLADTEAVMTALSLAL